MAAVLIMQTVAIVLLGVLVVGLLRSHAEILRQLHQLGAGIDPDAGAGVTSPVAAPVRRTASTGFDVTGTTPADEEVRIGVVGARQSTVLAFPPAAASRAAPSGTPLPPPAVSPSPATPASSS
jgi:hypothetical protein